MITNLTTYKLWKELLSVESKLDEGLIMTHDPFRSINAIDHYLKYTLKSSKYKTEYETEKRRIETEIVIKLNSAILLNLIKLFTNLGYESKNIQFVKYNEDSKYYLLDPKLTNYLYFKNNLLNNQNELDKYSGIKFFLYAKFDVKIQTKIDILYHITERKNNERILKYGLINKSNSILGFHEERIYLSKSIKGINTYFNIKNKNRYKNEETYNPDNFIVYSINVSNQNLEFFNYQTDPTLYEDPEALSYAVYTYDNIGPNLLTEIKDWSIND